MELPGTFEEFFKKTTGYAPFPYQVNLANSEKLPSLISVPTGLGKTAAIILGWLWKRRFATDSPDKVPRRLVYCLPMRVLVEQTVECATLWLKNLCLHSMPDKPNDINVHILMGGEDDSDWDVYPEKDSIIIGTQDMLLSRALNRGYAASRFRWPMQFSLLNNDCLWVMDEVQLMGNGLATTAQLQAFIRMMKTIIPTQSIWMSATMHPDWLSTVDFELSLDALGALQISNEDEKHPVAQARLSSVKHLVKSDFTSSNEGKSEAELAINLHTPGSRTLIVVNTVRRAQDIYQKLIKTKNQAEIVLLHSRFRHQDRQSALKKLLADPDKDGIIGVTTQVVEAGVDVSAKLLISDLAPWSSMVQRFGRCNRKGEYNKSNDAQVIWIEPENLGDTAKMKASPYNAEELCTAANRLSNLTNVGPLSLPEISDSIVYTHVIRKKDIVELFDTTPDLAGADIDVSRFIRNNDERQVQVFWRNFSKEGPTENEPLPRREELCSVPLGEKLLKEAWRWDHLEKRWVKNVKEYPGLVLMLNCTNGGYSDTIGWTGKEKDSVQPASSLASNIADANDSDILTESGNWQTIFEHTEKVVNEVEFLLNTFLEVSDFKEDILTAARYHDAGKAHFVFQNAITGEKPPGVIAKSANSMNRYERPGFRHELASSLAMLLNGLSDLSAYIAAAHHGKVRLSIRSLPHEKHPSEEKIRFARGIWDNDLLNTTDLGEGVVLEETVLNLSYMEMGDDDITGPSWLARMLKLRDKHGPFVLSFLETMLRIADWRASAQKEVENGNL